MSFLFQKASKQTSKLKMRQLQTISRNVILLSQSLQTDIEIENEVIIDHLWSPHCRVRQPPNRYRNWKRSNYRPFIITSFLCQKASKQILKLKTRQLQTIYDNVILVAESIQPDIEFQIEAITDHFW